MIRNRAGAMVMVENLKGISDFYKGVVMAKLSCQDRIPRDAYGIQAKTIVTTLSIILGYQPENMSQQDRDRIADDLLAGLM